MKRVTGDKGNGFTIAFALVSLGALVAGCINPGPKFNPYIPSTYQQTTFSHLTLTNNKASAELLKPSPALFTLGPGDKLELELLGDLTTRTTTTVGPDGKIYFHLLPGL